MNRIQIRQSIFETNSSSTHSLVFSGGKLGFKEFHPQDCETRDGRILLTGGEYGWGPYVLRRWQDKANYCYTYAMSRTYANGNPNPTEREVCLQVLIEVITEYTGLEVDMGKYGDEYWKYGHIDHQSSDVCGEAFESKEKLKDLIWGVGSTIIIDNDNH